MTSVRNIWGGSFEIVPTTPTTVDGGGDSPNDDEVKQSWLLRPGSETARKRKKGSCCVNGTTIFRSLVVVIVLAGLIVLVVAVARRHRHRRPPPVPDNYTVALHKALMFFNAQRSGKLPKQNNVSWRGNSCLNDEIPGGYYDGGSAVKYTFPASFATTILSWSVIEYSPKYEAAGELNHIKSTIKWFTDYLLNTFNSSHSSISTIALQVGGDLDQDCWTRPEDIDYPRPVTRCPNCPAVAAETAAGLAAASIVFKENKEYSKKLVVGAENLFKFATKGQGVGYSGGPDPPSVFYNSSGYWDEFLWGGTWLYLATGNLTYLKFATSPDLAKNDRGFWGGSNRGVVSWDNKHAAAQLLLTRIRIFLGYGYPYEEMLRTFQNNVENVMCSYLPVFASFKRTSGGLIQLNRGRARPLQYVVNAAFMATLYSDYLESNLVSGWQCGARFYRIEDLRNFATSQMDYILGKNPENMSYIAGFGGKFPRRVHHRGASIPNNKEKYGCKEGFKWRDSRRWNPNIIVGAMVGGPDGYDGFKDVRSNYNYTEATVAGNAGLVAALVALSGERSRGFDKNSMFYAIPPMFRAGPPPPAPWKP